MATTAEQLLKNITEARILSEQNAKAVLKATMREEMYSLIKESSMDDFVASEDTEATDDLPDMLDTGAPVDDGSMDSMPAEPEMETAPDAVDDLPDMTPPPSDDGNNMDDQVIETLEDLLSAIKDLDDDTQIEIVKSPNSFKIELTNDEPAIGMQECDESTENMDESTEEEGMEELRELDEYIYEVVEEEEQKMNEMVIERMEAIIVEYENKLNAQKANIQQLSEQTNALQKEKEKFLAEKQQFGLVLNEAQKSLDKLALDNTNLAHVAKLFTESALTVSEKKVALEQFDNVKTIQESKVLFSKLLTEQRDKSKHTEIDNLKTELKEEFSKAKAVIKEEKVFETDPILLKFQKYTNYKPKK